MQHNSIDNSLTTKSPYKKVFFFIIFIALIWSIKSIRLIAGPDTLGLDFHNMHAYHHCEIPNTKNIYEVDCKDKTGRSFIYPPHLYYLFSWTRISNDVMFNYYFWAFFIFLSLFISLKFWVKIKDPFEYGFLILLCLQFPALFSIERGNNDIFILIFWTLAFILHSKNQLFLTCLTLSYTFFSKLYPATGIFILLPSLIGFKKNQFSIKTVLFFIISVSILFFILFDLNFYYFTKTLPSLTKAASDVYACSHNIVQFFGRKTIVLQIILLSSWTFYSIKKGLKDQLVWAGALAQTTYYSGISFDYNLITVFPLIALYFKKSSNNFNYKNIFIFTVLVIAFLFDREFFDLHKRLIRFHMLLQIGILILIPWLELKHFSPKRQSP